MARVVLAPLARFPIVQTPVPVLYSVPAAGDAETNVSPGGRTSLTVTPVAGLYPAALLRVTVNVTLLPTVGVGLLTSLAIERSMGNNPASWLESFWPELSVKLAVAPVVGSASLS